MRTLVEEILKLVPEIFELNTVKQNPVYHGEGSVWNHTFMVLDKLFEEQMWQELNDEEKKY